jgi:hypothetical protein
MHLSKVMNVIFEGFVMATLLDRVGRKTRDQLDYVGSLTHHVHMLEMNGDSYRLTQNRRKTAANELRPHPQADPVAGFSTREATPNAPRGEEPLPLRSRALPAGNPRQPVLPLTPFFSAALAPFYAAFDN